MAIFGNFLPYYNNFISYGLDFGKTSVMQELMHLRNELRNLTEDILEKARERALIVRSIQALKTEAGQKSWDSTQELKVFKNYIKKEGATSSAQELLWLSLLIEAQAAKHSDYPKWSESSHIDGDQTNLYTQINPILVFLTKREEYNKLNFTHNYDVIFKELFKNE